MISFPCHCGHRFDLDDDMAGALTQCPKCGRLNDVPTHADLANLDQDGTYRLDEPVQDTPGRLEELQHIYYPGKVDEHGQEIDLRSYDNLAVEDDEGIPLEPPDHAPARGIPKYDPETGELLRPLDVRPDPGPPPPANPEDIPFAKPLGIPYARGDTQQYLTPFKVPFLLLMPANVAVLFFVFMAHLAGYFILFLTLYRFYFVGPFFLVVLLLIISHYANIIEDIGPQENDELPRPMRGAEWREDIWGPFTSFTGALLICYFPAVMITWLNLPSELTKVLVLAMIGLGTWFFPAVVLTTATSGSSLNLHPFRILGVIRACGLGYLWAVILWIAAAGVYLAGLGMLPLIVHSLGLPTFARWLGNHTIIWYTLLPTLAIGIYLMHLFCWHMGLLYRGHHLQFGWVLQRHEWQPRMPLPPRRKRRAAPPTPGQSEAPPRVSSDRPVNPTPPRQRLQQID